MLVSATILWDFCEVIWLNCDAFLSNYTLTTNKNTEKKQKACFCTFLLTESIQKCTFCSEWYVFISLSHTSEQKQNSHCWLELSNMFRHFVFIFSNFWFWRPFWLKNANISRPFWIVVFQLEYWNSNLNLVFSQSLFILTFAKIDAKLWSWQCLRFFDNMAAMTSSWRSNFSNFGD